MLKKLLTKILIKILEPDTVELTRRCLLGRNLDIIDEKMLTGIERRNYLIEADLLYHNKILNDIINKRIRDRIEFIARDSDGWTQVIFGRGGINELDLLENDINELHALYHQENVEPNKFDKGEVI